jgi:hypothetical protein
MRNNNANHRITVIRVLKMVNEVSNLTQKNGTIIQRHYFVLPQFVTTSGRLVCHINAVRSTDRPHAL